jgi:hypothetical protein
MLPQLQRKINLARKQKEALVLNIPFEQCWCAVRPMQTQPHGTETKQPANIQEEDLRIKETSCLKQRCTSMFACTYNYDCVCMYGAVEGHPAETYLTVSWHVLWV